MGMKTSVAVNEKTGVSICYTSDNDGIPDSSAAIPQRLHSKGLDFKDLQLLFRQYGLPMVSVEVGQTAYSIGTAQYALLPQNWVIDLDYIATYTLSKVVRMLLFLPAPLIVLMKER